MKRALSMVALCAVLMLPLGVPAAAESHEEAAAPQPIIWVSVAKSTHGNSQALIQEIIKQNTPLYSKLLADGHALEWGVAQPITHEGNDPWNVAEWVTFSSWAGVDAFVAAFMAGQAAMSEEEKAAVQEAFDGLVVEGSHADAVHQSLHAETNGERPGYIVIGYQKAKPGQGEALTGMWKNNAKPVYDQLMADGKIQGFGLFTQALHGDHSWTHASWETVSGLVGMSDTQMAFRKSMTPETMAGFMEMVEWEGHRDQVLVVIHYERAKAP